MAVPLLDGLLPEGLVVAAHSIRIDHSHPFLGRFFLRRINALSMDRGLIQTPKRTCTASSALS